MTSTPGQHTSQQAALPRVITEEASHSCPWGCWECNDSAPSGPFTFSNITYLSLLNTPMALDGQEHRSITPAASTSRPAEPRSTRSASPSYRPVTAIIPATPGSAEPRITRSAPPSYRPVTPITQIIQRSAEPRITRSASPSSRPVTPITHIIQRSAEPQITRSASLSYRPVTPIRAMVPYFVETNTSASSTYQPVSPIATCLPQRYQISSFSQIGHLSTAPDLPATSASSTSLRFEETIQSTSRPQSNIIIQPTPRYILRRRRARRIDHPLVVRQAADSRLIPPARNDFRDRSRKVRAQSVKTGQQLLGQPVAPLGARDHHASRSQAIGHPSAQFEARNSADGKSELVETVQQFDAWTQRHGIAALYSLKSTAGSRHLASKQHLSAEFNARTSALNKPEFATMVRNHDAWIRRYGIDALLAQRLAAKELRMANQPSPRGKKTEGRGGGGVVTAEAYRDVLIALNNHSSPNAAD